MPDSRILRSFAALSPAQDDVGERGAKSIFAPPLTQVPRYARDDKPERDRLPLHRRIAPRTQATGQISSARRMPITSLARPIIGEPTPYATMLISEKKTPIASPRRCGPAIS